MSFPTTQTSHMLVVRGGDIKRAAKTEYADTDAVRFALDGRNNAGSSVRLSCMGSIKNVAQLEIMAELAHPLWGLPRLRKCNEFVKHVPPASGGCGVSVWKRAKDGCQAKGSAAASDFAKAAIRAVNIPRSLDSVEQILVPISRRGYPFEYLYGLFKFLVDAGAEFGKDKTEYALHLLPRLFWNKLEQEHDFYTNYIPNSLTVTPNAITDARIMDCLEASFVCAKDAFGADSMAKSYKTHQWWPLSNALRAFTFDQGANLRVANATATWLNHNMRRPQVKHWYLDGIVYQLFRRADELVDHKRLKAYLHGGLSSACSDGAKCTQLLADCTRHCTHQKEMLIKMVTEKYGNVKSYTSSELFVASELWMANDFDLIVELLRIHTRERPDWSATEISRKFATVLEPLAGRRYGLRRSEGHERTEHILFKESLKGMQMKRGFKSARAKGNATEFAKQVGRVVDASDVITSQSTWEHFCTPCKAPPSGTFPHCAERCTDLQEAIALLRLAARYPNKEQRQQQALEQLVKLFTERRQTQAVVHTLFIRDHLMIEPRAVNVDQVRETLSKMLASAKPREHKGHDVRRWPKQPDWWDQSMVARQSPFHVSICAACTLNASGR